MFQLIREEDFAELPEEPGHRWLALEKVARARLQSALETDSSEQSDGRLIRHYMAITEQLAKDFGVDGVSVGQETSLETTFEKFELSVSRAQARIWSKSIATYPFGRAELSKESKSTILSLSVEIERQINMLDVNDKRRDALHRRLEEFRREVNQPKTRVGIALSCLAQISTVVAMTTATVAQFDDAYVNISKLLGAGQLEAQSDEIFLLETEKQLLLSPPPKQIEGPKE
jgi:hypothetical protein